MSQQRHNRASGSLPQTRPSQFTELAVAAKRPGCATKVVFQQPARVGGSVTFLYNGENLLLASCPNDALPQNCAYNTSSGRTKYGYDCERRRVTRSDSTGTTTFVYDAGGQLAAEYGAPGSATGTTYLTDDQLGSTRVVTDAGGGIVSRRDYLLGLSPPISRAGLDWKSMVSVPKVTLIGNFVSRFRP
jgi:hypothetical protein